MDAQTPRNLEAALQYAAMGYPVFPCKPGTKQPATEHGFTDATTDVEQVNRWWGENPDYNVAMPTQGLCVLDVDGPTNVYLYKLSPGQLAELSDAPMQRTPRGGLHFVTRQNGEVLHNTTSKLADKVDTRADGGYIVVAPSVFNGNAYSWERPLQPVDQLPVVPAWLVEALKTAKPQAKTGKGGPPRVELLERCWAYVQKCPDAISGEGGHPATYRVACECFRFGLTDAEANEILRRFNATKTGGEQWREKELAHKLEGARQEVITAGEFGSRVKSNARNRRSKKREAERPQPPPAPAADQNGIEPICTNKGATEAMNARRFAVRFGANVRYCHPWVKWLTWDKTRWAIDDSGIVGSLAKEIGKALWAEAEAWARLFDPEEDKGVFKLMTMFCTASNSDHGLRAMLAIARSEPGIPVAPSQLDGDPWLFNVQNGTINLRTGKLQDHRREDYITKLAPVTFNASADCPVWCKFLKVVLADVELRAFVRRLVGYCLTGSTQEHVLPFLYGIGSNGKSTFLNVVLALLGVDYAIKAPTDLLLAKKNETHPTELADLFGKRFVACIEAEDGRRLAESLVKELTGGDRIRARHMREDFWEFSATHKIWLAANHKPQVRGTDHGIWRRIKLIPFTVIIPDDQQDKELLNKLLAELPGILNWALAGCLEWQQAGLGEPPAVKAATADYRNEMDVLGDFIADRCIIGDDYGAGSAQLFEAYKAWAESAGERPVTQRRFGLQMVERGFRSDRYTAGPHKGRNYWRGIGIIQQ